MARVVIVTVSDSTFEGDRSDTSGEAVRLWCERRGDQVVAKVQAADETAAIVPLLLQWCDSGQADLILTTGGTGLAPRDVTPEATRTVIEREAPGIQEYIRASSFGRLPKAALSRGVAGTRGKTLVINLPGSTSGVQDGLDAIAPIIDHAVDILNGSVTRHDTPPANAVVK